MNASQLYLHEELFLLSLKDPAASAPSGSMLSYALAGAALAELLLHERIRVDDSRRKRVHVAKERSIGEPTLDVCLRRIRDASRPAPLRTWVTRLAGTRGLKRNIAQGLCKRGVLKSEERRVLLFFNRTLYRQSDPKFRRDIADRITESITQSGEVDARTVILISLAKNSGLLNGIVGAKTVRENRARIKQLLSGEMVGKATKEAMEAVQVAIMVAAVMPAITSTNSGK